MMVPALSAYAYTAKIEPWDQCFTASQADLATLEARLGPSNGMTVQTGMPVMFSGYSGSPVTFAVVSSPMLLSSPDIDSGIGSAQPEELYTFISTTAAATPRTVYWDASFSDATLKGCEGLTPSTYTTQARTLTVLSPSSSPSMTPAIPTTTATPVGLPPNLQMLERKMGELKVTSLRFSEKTSVAAPHGEDKILSLLKVLLGGETSGEGTTSPPAANVVLGLFGHPLTLRKVGNTTYFYLRALASKDHGRPWIKLGPGGFAELVTVNGKHTKAPAASEPKIGEPALAEPPFEGLRKALAGAKEVRELGAGTLYGQPVTSFLAVLEPEQLKRENLVSAARLGLSASQAPTSTLEVSLAQNGLPVRTVITGHDQSTVISVALAIPAINFPLVIAPPPASQTISVAQLRKLERQAREHGHRSR
jgi:hypothetical protein